MTPRKATSLITPPVLTEAQLQKARAKAIEAFRAERMHEPLQLYLDELENARDAFEELLATTDDLTRIYDQAHKILTDARLLAALRYLPGPPISDDDLRTVANVGSMAPKLLAGNQELAERVIKTVMLGLDRARFPWLEDKRAATDEERAAAILASAALVATQRVATLRRNGSKTIQETAVSDALIKAGFRQVPKREAKAPALFPKPGEFCDESLLGSRKADVLVGLWDHRVLPIECKVSNSEVNSIKRVKNDAAVKAVTWRKEFGDSVVVPAAVLSGVFHLQTLVDAQSAGLTLFWAHGLKAMIQWIDSTRGA